MTDVKYFGFLYETDPKTQKPSDGVTTCKRIMHIPIPKKKKPEDAATRMLSMDFDDVDGRDHLRNL